MDYTSFRCSDDIHQNDFLWEYNLRGSPGHYCGSALLMQGDISTVFPVLWCSSTVVSRLGGPSTV